MNKYVKKLGLGTVQWGMDYGISNRQGQTSSQEVTSILNAAYRAGISLVDTASLYGSAEQVLGGSNLTAFKVVTKTPKFQNNSITSSDTDNLKKGFHASLQKLGLNSVYGLLLHDVNNIFAREGSRLVNALDQLRSEGLVLKIGVTVYSSLQIYKTLDYFKPDIVQLPINVLDQRLVHDGTLTHLSRLGIEVHARSVFLQGLLLMDAKAIPNSFQPWLPILMKWHQACRDHAVSPLDAAISYVCNLPDVSFALVGVQNLSQLKEITVASGSVDGFDFNQLSCNDANLLDPTTWVSQ